MPEVTEKTRLLSWENTFCSLSLSSTQQLQPHRRCAETALKPVLRQCANSTSRNGRQGRHQPHTQHLSLKRTPLRVVRSIDSSSDECLFNVWHGSSRLSLSSDVYAFCVLSHLHCQSAHVHMHLMLCMHGIWPALEGP